MRRNLNTQADFVAVGGRLVEALAANTASLSHLEPLREKLDTMLTEMRELMAEQDALSTSKQMVSKQIQRIHEDGTKLVHLLRKSVQEHYGTRSEQLAQFGVQPFRGRPRRQEEVTTPNPTSPPPTVE